MSRDGEHPFQSKAASVAFFYIGGCVRIGWLLLFFPSLAFAISGCPVGVQLGNVTMATPLPVCLKFEGSQLGGCLVACNGVCVELPLANTKGPVETTGTACSITENGSGNGDSDGSGNTPGEGPSGTKPIDGWLNFEPVIGDATGTSVSGAVAKLNKNLGVALRQVVDGTKQDSANLNVIAHSAESLARDMKTSLYHLDRMSNDLFYTKNSNDALLGAAYQTNEHLQSMISKMDGSGSSGGGSSAGGSSAADVAEIKKMMTYAMGMWASQQGSLASVNNQMSSMLRDVGSTAASLSGIRDSVLSIRDSVSNGGSDGQGVDYSKMPGSSGNPLSVGGSSYNSACSGENCFFDVPAMDKKLADTNKSLTDKYASIAEDVKQVFSFSLTGSADPMECLDLFTHQGKEYTICPPSGDYWKTLAALMMFIFYFVALMIIFKR
ncbi:hypothetical protein ACK34M_17170 [Aeromonas veronii]|uniref:hypothetical protein n=1 Tax=Aeromonas sp. Y301-2 TaxID=2990505 RepID=UPI0022DF7B01|nr:hypothetical protein [Aeromonas sp. Y301-2]